MVASPRVVAGNLLLERELAVVADALTATGVPAASFKGVVLARRLGVPLERRPLLDNDLLVRRGDAEAATAVLASLGYAPLQAGHTLRGHLRSDFQLAYARTTGAGRVVADLHWAPFPPRTYPVDEELVWRHLERVDVQESSVLTFDRPLTLVHLAAHFAQHRFTEERIARDLATAWNRWRDEIDVVALTDLARVTALHHALAYAFAVADRMGMLAAPAPPVASRRAARLTRHFPHGRPVAPAPDRDYGGALVALSLAPLRRVPGSVATLLFPPLETLAAVEGRPVTPALGVRYVARLLRGAGRWTGARRR